MDGIYSQLLTMLLLFSVLGGAFWYTRRLGLVRWSLRAPNANAQAVNVVQRIVLTPNHTAHLIEVGGRQILIGCSPRSCEMIADITGDLPQATSSQESK
jgi:flagellar biogenesis protein FliO